MKNLKLLAISVIALLICFSTGCATLRDIDRDSLRGPDKVRQYENLNPNDFIVYGIYGTDKDPAKEKRTVRSDQIGFSNFDSSRPGVQTISVRITSMTTRQAADWTLEVMPLISLRVTQPAFLFKQGVTPDPTWPGLVIEGIWNELGSKQIPLRDLEISGYLKDQPGEQKITVKFGGQETTFDVTVRSMASLEIVQPPSKRDYFYGIDTVLDLKDLSVKGIWGDGFPDEVFTITAADVTGFNPTASGTGNQTISITKNGRTATFTVKLWALQRIDIKEFPTKINYYRGEELNLAGIEITGQYGAADTSEARIVNIPFDMLAYSGYDANRIGTNRVTITVKGQPDNITATIPISVTEPPAGWVPPAPAAAPAPAPEATQEQLPQ